jgi:mycothiol synthase
VGDAPAPPRVRVTARPTDAEVRAILALADEAARADGAHPLREHVVLHLRHGAMPAQHVLVEDPQSGRLLGYAHLDLSDPEGPAAEIAVSPAARRRGVGTTLLGALLDADPDRRLQLWAHGADAAAAQLAASRGFHRVRRLWQMRRSLFAPLDPVVLPPGTAVRTFDPGRDADAWLELNARAFANLPDQAGWRRADLDRRLAEPWFDPAGFLLAEGPEGSLIGFHWTKVHGHHHDPDVAHHDHPHDPLGEVYVVGVDPGFRGLGLGRALTLAGLHHLRGRGLPVALLYVDADNAPAIALYRSLGFAVWDSDTLFRR